MPNISKKQKTWLWIFAAMFALPEILFFITPLYILSFLNNFSTSKVIPPIYYLVNQSFFSDNIVIMFLILAMEVAGVGGLFWGSLKFRKKYLSIILGIFLVWLCLVFSLTVLLSKADLVM